jgi:hypothetical protein
MEYSSRHYSDLMANLYYNDNFYNDTVRERDAYSRFLIIFYFIFSNRPFKFYSFNN